MSSVPTGSSAARFDAPGRGNPLGGWWQGLAHREQRIVSLGVVVVLLVIGYVLLWEPAADGIRKLGIELPQLRTQTASMHAMADEAARLRGSGAGAPPVAPNDRVAAVRRSLDRAGLARGSAATAAVPQGPVTTLSTSGLTVIGGATTQGSAGQSAPEVTEEAGGRVRVRFDNIDYGVWIGWLAATEGELSARAARVSAVSLGTAGAVGRVKTDALLDWNAAPAAPGRPAS